MQRYINTKIASEMFGIPVECLRHLCLIGKIEATKPAGGRKWFLTPQAVERYIQGYPARTEKEKKRRKTEKELKEKNILLVK